MEEADRTAEVKLLTYAELYLLWERQQWLTQDLDFSRDREDWHERIPDEERFQRMYGLSSFFIGEQKVAEELGPIMRAAPTEDQKLFLCTQIADEARHVRFFERFYREVGVLESDELSQMLEQTSEHLNDNFGRLFDEMLKQRTDRLSVEPEDTEALVEAVTLYHMVIEGMLALTGQHFIMDFNEREGTLPAFVEGFQNVARDEHRHVAFGSVFLREKAREDDRYKEAIQRALAGVAAGRRRCPLTALGRGGRGLGSVRLLARRNAPVRRDLPGAQAQGDRPDLGAWTIRPERLQMLRCSAGASFAGGLGRRRRRSFDRGRGCHFGRRSGGGAADRDDDRFAAFRSAGGAGSVVVASVTAGAPLPSAASRRRRKRATERPVRRWCPFRAPGRERDLRRRALLPAAGPGRPLRLGSGAGFASWLGARAGEIEWALEVIAGGRGRPSGALSPAA